MLSMLVLEPGSRTKHLPTFESVPLSTGNAHSDMLLMDIKTYFHFIC